MRRTKQRIRRHYCLGLLRIIGQGAEDYHVKVVRVFMATFLVTPDLSCGLLCDQLIQHGLGVCRNTAHIAILIIVCGGHTQTVGTCARLSQTRPPTTTAEIQLVQRHP